MEAEERERISIVERLDGPPTRQELIYEIRIHLNEDTKLKIDMWSKNYAGIIKSDREDKPPEDNPNPNEHLRQHVVNIFPPIANPRGKSPFIKYLYDAEERVLTMKINKHHMLNQARISQGELFNIAGTFTSLWQTDYTNLINNFFDFYKRVGEKDIYRIELRQLDALAITFDVKYLYEKKTYRFRYSLFQFKNVPVFLKDEKNTQIIACITDHSKFANQELQFYSAPRLFFIDDIHDQAIFKRISERFHFFYQIYIINRGSLSDNDEFLKKTLHNVYFQSTRMKKFSLTFLLKRPYSAKLEKKEEPWMFRQERQPLKVQFYFYIETPQEVFNQEQRHLIKLRVSIIDNDKAINWMIKEEVCYKLKEWQRLLKEHFKRQEGNVNPNALMFHLERIPDRREDNRNSKYIEERVEQFEFYILMKEKADKLFTSFEIIISTVLDRNYQAVGGIPREGRSNYYDPRIKREDYTEPQLIQKFSNACRVALQTKEFEYHNEKSQNIHFHSLKIVLHHIYFAEGLRSDSNSLKFGEWRFEHIIKMKKRMTEKEKQEKSKHKNKSDGSSMECEQKELSLSAPLKEVLKRYLNGLLRQFPLRLIDKEIIEFVESMVAVIYTPQEEETLIKPIPARESIFVQIFIALLNLFIPAPQEQSGQSLSKQAREECKNRLLLLRIARPGDFEFVPDNSLIAEVSFKLSEFKMLWIPKYNYGYLILRVYINQRGESWVVVEKDSFKYAQIRYEQKSNFQKELKHAITVALDQTSQLSMII